MTDFNDIASRLASLDNENPTDYSKLREETENALLCILSSMFPLHTRYGSCDGDELITSEEYLRRAFGHLTSALSHVMTAEEAADCSDLLLSRLPGIKEILLTDVEAAYEGDPAAKSTDEVILTYPAFTAIGAYRVAHELYVHQVPLIPRIMTEYAHRVTGIDIHPGATIGKRFFIDHGTGVVIGETTTIGEHVKLYQHVTLGAKSFEVAEDGSLVKGIKRHPDIGDNVVVYAGATILGGDTRIGNNCVIGGNVWLTHSVPDGETVIAAHMKEHRRKTI
ncbi:MAG: serine acetyltransferase [Oscillospiraceae bacterium]|nr:serine acetyltransferase [Oscillospiraceae bacterium]MBR5045509.1 serine acetyltransferase [Oscillospiraceae bacterium]MBR5070350.1 serine acetyltransferase [Oscillospiraceae bacterium]